MLVQELIRVYINHRVISVAGLIEVLNYVLYVGAFYAVHVFSRIKRSLTVFVVGSELLELFEKRVSFVAIILVKAVELVLGCILILENLPKIVVLYFSSPGYVNLLACFLVGCLFHRSKSGGEEIRNSVYGACARAADNLGKEGHAGLFADYVIAELSVACLGNAEEIKSLVSFLSLWASLLIVKSKLISGRVHCFSRACVGFFHLLVCLGVVFDLVTVVHMEQAYIVKRLVFIFGYLVTHNNNGFIFIVDFFKTQCDSAFAGTCVQVFLGADIAFLFALPLGVFYGFCLEDFYVGYIINLFRRLRFFNHRSWVF